jgi:ADP-L-glycero-D-manno-heptose 6-epimerase
VTGGAGFIGSNVAHSLARDGYRVVIVDWLGSDDKWQNLQDFTFRDIIMPEVIRPWLEENGRDVAAIVHMGAISATTERDVDLIVQSNIRLSLDLWDITTKRGIPFIYASSAATYGDGALGFTDSEDGDALQALRPLNPYGWSKLAVDRIIAAEIRAGAATPPQWAGLRFFNVYGPNEDHKGEMRSVVNKIFPDVMAGKPVMLFKSHRNEYEDGGQLRDFIHVDDCVNVIRWLLNMPKVSGIFNVGTGQARAFRELAEATFTAGGQPVNIVYRDMPESIRERYQYFTQADMSKLRGFGYNAPFLSLEDGVASYVETALKPRLGGQG